jgi:hypothetical protein
MAVPSPARGAAAPRRGSVLAAGLLLVATALMGCAPSESAPASVAPTLVGPTTVPTTAASPTASTPSASPSSPEPASFTWVARPDLFPGEDGASLVNVAAGPAGIVALWARPPGEGSPTMSLWGSADGFSWQSINPTGLPDRVYISGLWGAAGRYWLRGHLPDSEDPGILYRSSDGVAWRESRQMSARVQSLAVVDGCEASMTGARDACPVFLTGTRDVDGAIWRSMDGGDTWVKSTVDDATGWTGAQDAAAVEILGVVTTSNGLLAFGNGLPNATDTGGYLQSRFWRSSDAGLTWSRVPNAAPLGELYVEDVVVGRDGIVAAGRSVDDSIGVALLSIDGGRTWSRSTTSGARADGSLRQVFATGGGLLGLGYTEPAAVDSFPVQERVWSSEDGASWLTGPAGDLEGGVVEDAVQFGGMIVAVGRAWTTDATGTWDAPFGPAVWVLELSGG